MSKVNNPSFQYKPTYKHDSDTCIFLGTYRFNSKAYDLYYSEHNVLIARYGIEADYIAIAVSDWHLMSKYYSSSDSTNKIVMNECVKRAQMFGYMD